MMTDLEFWEQRIKETDVRIAELERKLEEAKGERRHLEILRSQEIHKAKENV